MAISTKTMRGAVYGVFGALVACGAMIGCGDDSSNGGSGSTGKSGTAGTSGTSGTAGTSGTSGTAGTSGTSGTAGTTGSGTTGTAGTTGSADGGVDATMTGPADSSAPDTGMADTSAGDTGAITDSGGDAHTGIGDGSIVDASSDASACVTDWPTDGGANLVGANFDAGSTAWNALYGAGTVGTSTFAHCATPSVELSARSASYSVLAYPLPSGAATYNVALWVAHDLQVDGGGASLIVSVQGTANCGDDGAQTFDVAFPTVASNTFAFVSGTLTIPAGCNTVSLIIGQGAQDQGLTAPFPDLFVDDVYVGP